MTNKEAVEILNQQKYPYPEHYKDIEVNEALDLAIRALEERDDLIERAYGHIVGQGTKGVIRPDDLETDAGVQEQSNLFCPRCHVATVIRNVLTINYCPHCGAQMKGEEE